MTLYNICLVHRQTLEDSEDLQIEASSAQEAIQIAEQAFDDYNNGTTDIPTLPDGTHFHIDPTCIVDGERYAYDIDNPVPDVPTREIPVSFLVGLIRTLKERSEGEPEEDHLLVALKGIPDVQDLFAGGIGGAVGVCGSATRGESAS